MALKLGAPSPYADDPFHYVWDWCADVYLIQESSTEAPSAEVPSTEAKDIVLRLSFRADNPESIPDLADLLDSPAVTLVQYTATIPRRPIAVLWQVVDGDFVVFSHPAWQAVDWATHAHST